MRAVVAAILAVLVCASARAEGIFDLARRPGESVWVTLDERMPSAEVRAEPPMLRRVHGVLAMLTSEQVTELLACVDNSAEGTALADAARVCVVHIDGAAGRRSVSIDQSKNGGYSAKIIGPSEGIAPGGTAHAAKRCQLRADRVDRLMGAAGYFGTFDGGAAPEPRGTVFEVAKPYQNGSVMLDAKTIGDRIGMSGYIRFDPTARALGNEKFFARLPARYEPRRPARLVVWMDPSPDGRPPHAIWQALDDLGMLAIGAASAGNDRGVTDRLQLALDAVATARRRWNVDPSRVYAIGVSGGGKMASILAPCFPDVFAGALPIVGLSTYQRLPTGDGGKAWPPEYSKPKGKRWEAARKIRMAAITGTNDFNHAPILAAAAGLKRDGVQIQLLDVPGMAHEIPGPDVIATQLGWVDEAPRAVIERGKSEARAALEKLKGTGGDVMDVVRRWPWTEAAWEVVDGLEKRGGSEK